MHLNSIMPVMICDLSHWEREGEAGWGWMRGAASPENKDVDKAKALARW